MVFEFGPYVSLATFCEQVIEDKQGVLSLIRIVDRLNVSAHGSDAPEEMPATNLSWFLVLTLKSGRTRGSHQLKIVPELPSGLSMSPWETSIHLEGDNKGATIVNQFNLALPMPGIYWFKIFFDDTKITQIPLEVVYSRTTTG